MEILRRFCIWVSSASLVIALDVITKASPHAVVAGNRSHALLLVYLLVGVFLLALTAVRSSLLAFGVGLMFGALCGNAGELLFLGAATDWIPIGGWLTNVADIAGGIGLLCSLAGYGRLLSRRLTLPEPTTGTG